jgi:hypothetical protein
MRRAKNQRINSKSKSKSIQRKREEEGNTSQIRIQKSKNPKVNKLKQTSRTHPTPTQHSQEPSLIHPIYT